MESKHFETMKEEKQYSCGDLSLMDMKIDPEDADMKDMDNSEPGMKSYVDDGEPFSEPKAEPEFGSVSEETNMGVNFEVAENTWKTKSKENAMNRENDDTVTLMGPVSLPLNVDFEGASEDTKQEISENTEENVVKTKFYPGDLVFAKMKGYPTWPAKILSVVSEKLTCIKYSVYFFGTGNSAVCAEKNVFGYADTKALYGKPLKYRGFQKALDEIQEAASFLEQDMDNSEHMMERDTDDGEALTEPKTEPDFERVSEETKIEEKLEVAANTWNMESKENDMKRERDDVAEFMKSECVPISIDFEGLSEETKEEISESTEVNNKVKEKLKEVRVQMQRLEESIDPEVQAYFTRLKIRDRLSATSSAEEVPCEEDEDCAAATCLRPTGSRVLWVQCDARCNKWFHFLCEGLEENNLNDDDEYICNTCRTQSISADLPQTSSSDLTLKSMELSAVSTDQVNFFVEQEEICKEIKEEPMAPLPSNISCEETIKNETGDGETQGAGFSLMMEEKLEERSVSSLNSEPESGSGMLKVEACPHIETAVSGNVFIHQANILVKEETGYIEIKEEPITPPSSESETLHEDIKESAVNKMRKEKPETSYAGCCSHSLQPDIVDPLLQRITSTSDETDTRRSSVSEVESRVSIHQTNIVVKEEPDCIEVKEEPLSPLASCISCEEPVKNETHDEDIQVSSATAMKKKLESTSFASFHCDALGELSPGTESDSAIAETPRPIMTQMDSSKKGIRGTYIECSTACTLQIASSSSQPLLAEAVGMSTQEHSCVLLQNVDCQTPFAMASCSTAIGGYLSERHIEEKVAEESQARRRAGSRRERERTCNSGRRSERGLSTEISLPEREMEKAPSLRSSCEESVRESNGKAFECSTCKKQFPSKILLYKHMQRHTGEKCYMCSHCEKSFCLRGHLTRHMRIHSGEKSYKCSYCDKSFSHRGNLIIHIRIHSGEKPYKCSQCKKSFTDSGDLTKHLHIHTGKKPFKCSHCEKSFRQRGHLVIHMRIHSGEKPYKCSQCEKLFSTKGYLNVHMRFHRGEKSYKCIQCEKSFYKSSDLTVHMRSHTGEKPYKCSQCKKSFSNRGDLTKHLHIHTGKKPFKCSQCEKSFGRRAHLNRHMRIHSGEKPYKCSQCEKSFGRRAHLNRHMRIHTGDKPFKCNHCDKSFSNRSNLTRHKRIHK